MNKLRALCIVIVAVLSLPLAVAQDLLDGRRFIGDFGPAGKPASETGDVITFEGGKFHSAVCDQWGFGKGEYRAVQEGDVIRFEATTLSDSAGRLHWRGSVRGDVLEGTFTHYRPPSWWRPNPQSLEHWVKATRKR